MVYGGQQLLQVSANPQADLLSSLQNPRQDIAAYRNAISQLQPMQSLGTPGPVPPIMNSPLGQATLLPVNTLERRYPVGQGPTSGSLEALAGFGPAQPTQRSGIGKAGGTQVGVGANPSNGTVGINAGTRAGPGVASIGVNSSGTIGGGYQVPVGNEGTSVSANLGYDPVSGGVGIGGGVRQETGEGTWSTGINSTGTVGVGYDSDLGGDFQFGVDAGYNLGTGTVGVTPTVTLGDDKANKQGSDYGAAAGAAIGTAIMPGVGTAIGSLLGSALGSVVGGAFKGDPNRALRKDIRNNLRRTKLGPDLKFTGARGAQLQIDQHDLDYKDPLTQEAIALADPIAEGMARGDKTSRENLSMLISNAIRDGATTTDDLKQNVLGFVNQIGIHRDELIAGLSEWYRKDGDEDRLKIYANKLSQLTGVADNDIINAVQSQAGVYRSPNATAGPLKAGGVKNLLEK